MVLTMAENTGGINELRSLLADNHEATQLLGNVETTLQASVDRVNILEQGVTSGETKLTEAIVSRDKVRDIVKAELGITEFTPDAVRTKLATYASDDVLASRDKQINDLRASSGTKIETLEQAIKEKDISLRGMQMQVAISKTDVMGQTKGEHANAMLLDWIAEDAQFDEQGNIVYRGPSGETLYNTNSDPLTLEDRINEIKADSTRDFVFQSTFLAGGGAAHTDGGTPGPAGDNRGAKFVRSKMSFEEQSHYRSKYGEEAYKNLPMI